MGKRAEGSLIFSSPHPPVESCAPICKMMELGWIQFNSSTKHTALEVCGVEVIHTAREKALATPQSTFNRKMVLCERARGKIHPFWKQISEKPSWKKRLTLTGLESHKKNNCAFVPLYVHVREREREEDRQTDLGSGGRSNLGNDPKAGKNFPVPVPGVTALRRTKTKAPEITL